ncbi:MAG TPA: hypothetical protein VLV46_02780 [Gaiellaceae bacterium]|nr:hypothetical protein [Gaiellaceae bacterium]
MAVIRVVVLYGEEPDPEQYAAHAEVCRKVPGGVFRHGKFFGAPGGDPEHRYLAEWEFSDAETFKTATATDEFMATARDARERGLPRPTVEFVSLS